MTRNYFNETTFALAYTSLICAKSAPNYPPKPTKEMHEAIAVMQVKAELSTNRDSQQI